MQPLTFQRRHLQRTVWWTLAAWVLALLAGVVNACQVQPHGPGARASVESMQARHVGHGHDDGHRGHDGRTTDAGKAGCIKFCDDESSSVTKGKQVQPELPNAMIVANADWPTAIRVATVATWRSCERPASHGPPLVIRLLRLTI